MIKQTTKYFSLKEDEPPPKRLVTEGDILIKDLVEKQRKTNVTLNDYLNHEKTFEKISEHISLTSCHSGTTSLEQFKSVIGRIEDIECLRSAGLTNDDVQLLWDYRQNNLITKYKNIEHSILEGRITRILKMLQQYKSGNTEIESIRVRRSLNEEMLLAAKPNSTTTKLLKFAMDNKQKSETDVLVNSMDNLKEIEQDRFSYLDNEKLNSKKILKRIRNINTRINNIGKSIDVEDKRQSSSNLFVENSKWDVKKAEVVDKPKGIESKVYSCKPNNYYTIDNGEIVKLNENQSREKGLEVGKYKLNVEEIRKLPRFQNYHPGEPSKVLFLKNLPKTITIDDLTQIFQEHQDIALRIMSGKMKGQAFATFPDINQASRAFEEVNGLIINAKPIIVEYGRKGNT